ncbi:MAG: sugar porter family MFS transporter [Opitutaceae bacterium]
MTTKPYILFVSVVAAVGALLFGYDTAVVSGTVDALRTHFALDPLRLGWVVGSALIGSVAGVVLAGPITDWAGRRTVLAFSAFLFLISGIWCYLSRSETELVIARIVGGVGIGFASLLVPVYIAEIAPPKIRGAMVLLNQIGILVGMLLSYMVNAWIGSWGNDQWLADVGWRIMLGASAIPAAIFFILSFVIPESPRWLFKKGRAEAARKVLQKLHGADVVEAEKQEIQASLSQHQAKLADLFQKGLRGTVIMAVILAFFQAITGINIVMYYAPTIFTTAGVSTSKALSHSVIIGLVMLIFTMGAMCLVDRLGRRPIMMLGSAGMGIALVLLGFFFTSAGGSGWGLLACILAYVSFFSVGMGGVYFVVVSEIFPTRIRGTAASLSVVVLWCGNYLISLLFPSMLAALGNVTFYVFAFMCLLCFIFVFAFLPETKGKTLEDLEKSFFTDSRIMH